MVPPSLPNPNTDKNHKPKLQLAFIKHYALNSLPLTVNSNVTLALLDFSCESVLDIPFVILGKSNSSQLV